MGTYREVATLDDYRQLFAPATDQHRRVGEASVYYLRSSVALENTQALRPDASIIAMFRNPVDMVHSLHFQLLYWSEEVVDDFEAAWRLQARRRQGLELPPAISSPLLVQYAEVGQFGTQVRRLLDLFPREQVKLILFDDFSASPERVYDEVLAFSRPSA